MWSLIGKYALKIALFAIGHADVIQHVVADAKTKNIPGIVQDTTVLVTDVKAGA